MAITTEVCEYCGRLFRYPGFGTKYCQSCKAADDENRKKVKEYIREHGTANMHEVSEATGVSTKAIRQYLRDCTLEIPDGSPVFIHCENCGCDIKSGRWCPSCAAKMSRDLHGLYVGVGEVPKPKTGSGKMRFLGRDD